jgi:hypothetical protein
MGTSQNIKKLKERSDRYEYTGRFKDFQTMGSTLKGKRYSQYEKDPYNEYQNFLYKRAIFGLKVYTKKELKKLHPQRKEKIKKVHSRAQHELNLWKQEKLIELTNSIFSMFNNSRLSTQIIKAYSKPHHKFISRTSFKDLGIEKKDIIDRLVHKKVLPHNFDALTHEIGKIMRAIGTASIAGQVIS